MLAAMSDYFVLWQLPLWGVLVAGWIFGGGYLLFRGLRKAGVGGKRFKPGRCFSAMMLSGLAGALAGGIFGALVFKVGKMMQANAIVPAAIVAVVITLAIAYLVIYAMFEARAATALKVFLPAIGMIVVLGVAVGCAAFVPQHFAVKFERGKNACGANFERIQFALRTYHLGAAPAQQLDELVKSQAIGAQNIVCSVSKLPYYYRPSRLDASGESNRIVACDCDDSHGKGRWVLAANGQRTWYTTQEFAALLAQEVNRPVAEALQQSK